MRLVSPLLVIEELLEIYGAELLRSRYSFRTARSAAARRSTIRKSAAELEFSMNRLWIPCRHNIHTLTFEVKNYKCLKNDPQDHLIERYFCKLIALSPLMRYDFPKLARLELKAPHARSLALLLRPGILQELPQYAADRRGWASIFRKTESTTFFSTDVGRNNTTEEFPDAFIRMNQRRIKDIKITSTDERPL